MKDLIKNNTRTILDEITESVKNNENLMKAANKAVQNLKENYREAIDGIDIQNLDDYDNEVSVDYKNAVQDFLDEVESELDIDFEEILKSDDFEEQETSGLNDYAGCVDDKYQLAIVILSRVTDYYLIKDLFYSGDFFFPIDYEVINRKKGLKDLERALTTGEIMWDTIDLEHYTSSEGDEFTFTIDNVIGIYCKTACTYNEDFYKHYWVYIEEEKVLLSKEVLNKLISLGEVKNIDGHIAIKSTEEKEVKELLGWTFYSIVKNKNGYIETDIPFIAIETDIYFSLNTIGNTIGHDDDMTYFVIGDEEYDEIMTLKNYLSVIGKHIVSENDYIWTDSYNKEHDNILITTDLPWEEYHKNINKFRA